MLHTVGTLYNCFGEMDLSVRQVLIKARKKIQEYLKTVTAKVTFSAELYEAVLNIGKIHLMVLF